MAAFLANAGVNAAHGIHSPLHPDGSFELLPIPDTEPWAPPIVHMRWPEHRTELQTIGSHTRAVRRLSGPSEALVRKLCRCRS